MWTWPWSSRRMVVPNPSCSIVEHDLQGSVSHHLIDDLAERLILEIEATLSPGQQTADLRRIELVDHFRAVVYVGLLAGGHGRPKTGDRGIGRRRLICRRIDDFDGAFAHRHFQSGRPQVDVEGRADGPNPIVAGAHPKRPLRIMGYLEEGLTPFQSNDTLALAIVDPYPAIGIEIEGRAVRQRYRGLLTDRRLKAGLFLLPM